MMYTTPGQTLLLLLHPGASTWSGPFRSLPFPRLPQNAARGWRVRCLFDNGMIRVLGRIWPIRRYATLSAC